MGIRIDQLDELTTPDGTEFQVVADNNDLDEFNNPRDKKLLASNGYLSPTSVKAAYESNSNTNAFEDDNVFQLRYNYREAPICFSSGTNKELINPDSNDSTGINKLIVLNNVGKCYVDFGDLSWEGAGTIGGWIAFTSYAVSSNYGSISFSPHAGFWNEFDTSDGVRNFAFATGQGNFKYGYYETPWRIAFEGNNDEIVIAQNGDVYKDTISTETLVVTFDGIIGPAGAAPVASIADYALEMPAGSFDLYDNPADYDMIEGTNSNIWFNGVGTGDYLYAKVELPSNVKEGGYIKCTATGFARTFVSASKGNVSIKLAFAWSEFGADSWDIVYGSNNNLYTPIGTAQDMIGEGSNTLTETIPADKRFGLIRVTRTPASSHGLAGDYCLTGINLYFETE